MRLVRIFVVSLILMSVFFSCRKERSYENPKGTTVVNGQWQFSEAGSNFTGPMDSAYVRAIGVANSLSLSGVSSDGKGAITMQILSTGAFVPGDYKNPQVLFQYRLNDETVFENSSTDNFTITITSIDSISVSGTFSGVAIDTMGNQQTISSGKFVAPLSGFAPPVTGKGTLTLWSKQLCEGNGSIYIKVGDSVGAITQAYPSDPSCGAPGTATFQLPAGAYTVIAACGADTMTLDAAVLPDVCSTLEVDLSLLANDDYFPLISRWTYGAADNYETDTLAIESSGQTTLSGETFTKFVNPVTSETKYYNKGGGIYYQYLDSAFGFPVNTPSKFIILKDAVSVGGTWDSDPYVIPTFGTFKIRSTVTKKDYVETINGQSFENCIEVSSELYRLDGVTWDDADTGYRTVFSKGIGIIFYQDLGSDTDWQIRYYNVP